MPAKQETPIGHVICWISERIYYFIIFLSKKDHGCIELRGEARLFVRIICIVINSPTSAIFVFASKHILCHVNIMLSSYTTQYIEIESGLN